MKTELIETGALIVRAHKGTPFYEAKWRDGRKRQRKRRLGRAWLEPDPRGGWKRRRGRVCRGYLDERAAYREMARVIAEVEAEQQIAPTKREARFEDAVEAWFAYLEFEKRAKPSTLAGYRNLLAHPRSGDRGQRGARNHAGVRRPQAPLDHDAGHPALPRWHGPGGRQRSHGQHPSSAAPLDLRARQAQRRLRPA